MRKTLRIKVQKGDRLDLPDDAVLVGYSVVQNASRGNGGRAVLVFEVPADSTIRIDKSRRRGKNVSRVS